MVLRAIPVVRETATIPPRPAARASQAANKRRSLSLRNGPSALAGPDGILVDHPVRLDAKTPDSHRLFWIVRCVVAALWSLFYRVACFGSGP